MWTLQEVVMANEPLAVCGSKSIRWVDASWSLVRARNLPQNRSNGAFTNVFNSIIAAESFWNDHSQKYADTQGNVRNWMQGDGVVARFWHLSLDLLESTHPLVGRVQDGVILAFIIVRLLLGQRPLNSVWLLFIVLTRLLTRVITPQTPVRAHGTVPKWEIAIRSKLPGIMNKLRSRDAKLPVDKVFALYGIFEELRIPIQRPDYTKSMSQVYTEFACDLLRWHKSLELLSEASMPSMPGGPSWVPDWSRPHHRVCAGDYKAARDFQSSFRIVRRNSAGGRDGVESLINAGIPNEEWTSVDLRRDPTKYPKILTKGIVVDRINFCFPLFQQEESICGTEKGEWTDDWSLAFLKNIGILRSWLSTTPRTKSGVDQLANVTYSATLSAEHRSENFQSFSSWVNLLTARLDAPSDTNTSTAETAAHIRSLLMAEGLYKYHLERVAAISGKRAFFKTKNTHLGTGPLAVETGDVVALLAGLSCPIILRISGEKEEPNTYKVVGIAYIEGLMQGEAWPENEEKISELILV